jgi:hypothetical protein
MVNEIPGYTTNEPVVEGANRLDKTVMIPPYKTVEGQAAMRRSAAMLPGIIKALGETQKLDPGDWFKEIVV